MPFIQYTITNIGTPDQEEKLILHIYLLAQISPPCQGGVDPTAGGDEVVFIKSPGLYNLTCLQLLPTSSAILREPERCRYSSIGHLPRAWPTEFQSGFHRD